MTIIILLLAFSLPAVIFWDFKKRFGKPSWSWIFISFFMLISIAGKRSPEIQRKDQSNTFVQSEIIGTCIGVGWEFLPYIGV